MQQYIQLEEGSTHFFKHAQRDVRLGFIRKVYGILSAQLLLTVLIGYLVGRLPHSFFGLGGNGFLFLQIALGCTVALLCVMGCYPNLGRKYPTNYILLFSFTGFEGFIVGCICTFYTGEIVTLAVGITALVFVGMTAYAFFTKTDFTGYGPYLFGALIALFSIGCVLSLMSLCGMDISWMHRLYCALGVLVFTMYIVFDTQMILGEFKGHKVQFGMDDYVFAALNLYLDIINLFLYILALLGGDR